MSEPIQTHDDSPNGDRTTYDSRQRRDAWSQDLVDRGINEEVVAARVRADVSQAKPASSINQEQRAQPEADAPQAQPQRDLARLEGAQREERLR